MKILIIGGEGYIGQRLTNHLIAYHTVDTCDLGWFGEPGIINLDFNQLTEEELSDYEVVILLAGHSSVGMSKGNHLSAFNNNVRNFVELLYKLNPNEKFIFASSASVCSGFKNATEEYFNTQFCNEYDQTKAEIEQHAKLWGGEYYGLRFGTVCGFSPHLRTDLMINSFVSSIKTRNLIQICNGHISRAILGINDLCYAISSIINHEENNSGIYNLASFNMTVEQMAGRISCLKSVSIQDNGIQGVPYNFTLNTDKFCNTFRFKFCDTVDTITNELIDNWNKANKSDRSMPKEYYR